MLWVLATFIVKIQNWKHISGSILEKILTSFLFNCAMRIYFFGFWQTEFLKFHWRFSSHGLWSEKSFQFDFSVTLAPACWQKADMGKPHQAMESEQNFEGKRTLAVSSWLLACHALESMHSIHLQLQIQFLQFLTHNCLDSIHIHFWVGKRGNCNFGEFEFELWTLKQKVQGKTSPQKPSQSVWCRLLCQFHMPKFFDPPSQILSPRI